MDTTHRTTETNHDTYLNLSEAAARGYAGYSTLRKYIAEGRLPASRVGHRIRLRQSDLDALLTPVGTDPIDLTVERLVAAAPELTPEQVTRLRATLWGCAMNAADIEFQRIADTTSSASWTCTRDVISGVETAVLVRRVERSLNASRGTESGTLSEKRATESDGIAALTRADAFRPKSPMGVQTGLAGTATASVPAPASQHTFGDLPTVRAMGSGDRAPVIGFDTEFTQLADGSRVISSYQFSYIDPESGDWRIDVVLLPLTSDRLAVDGSLAVVIRETGLWRTMGLPDPRGIPRRDFWVDGDYRASVDALYRAHRLSIVLAGHYLKADLTAFARPVRQRGDGRYDGILRRVTSASGGLVSLKPIRMMPRSGGRGQGERWLPLSITVRDTMCQTAPGKKKLAHLGDACGVAKLDVGEAISDMSGMRQERLAEFLEYGANDAVIVVEYLTALWGLEAVPPVTLSGGGAHALRDGIKRYWGIKHQPNAEFMAKFQGLVRVDEGDTTDDDGLSYYSVRSLTPVDGDANQAHSAFKKAFHGGWNSCLRVGYFPTETYDHDIQSAYPSAMASVVDVDFERGCIEEVIKDRDLVTDDFPLGVVTPLSPMSRGNSPRASSRASQCGSGSRSSTRGPRRALALLRVKEWTMPTSMASRERGCVVPSWRWRSSSALMSESRSATGYES